MTALAAGIHAAPTSLPDEPPGWWIIEAGQRIGWARSQGDADRIVRSIQYFDKAVERGDVF